MAPVMRKAVIAALDSSIKIIPTNFCVEWVLSCEELVDCYSNRPHIRLNPSLAVVIAQLLGGYVIRSTNHERLKQFLQGFRKRTL